MIHFNNEDKRWLEIIFFLICKKIFDNNLREDDIIDFINGFRWTNMFDCDILIKTIKKRKILLDSNFIPSKHELIVTLYHNNCRLRMQKRGIYELVRNTKYKHTQREVFKTKLKEELNLTLIFPKLDNIPKLHATIYSFLLAIDYMGGITHNIKF